MGKGTIITLGVLGMLAVVAVSLFGTYVSYFNRGNTMEKAITAQYEENQNILSQYSLRVAEAAQVTELYTDDLKEVVGAAMAGRYGENGSQAVFQWLQEQNPNVDPALYVQVQRVIEAGRNRFENGQTALIEKKRVYETELGSFWGSIWFGVAGYPKIDLDDYPVIKSEHSNNAFETGIDRGINLRPERN